MLLWAISLQVIVCFTPATVLALANYHALKAKASANVINQKIKNQYNAAVAKNKANLSQLNAVSKKRLPRHIPVDENEKANFNDLPLIHIPATESNNIDEIDFPVDDTFMIHERANPENDELRSPIEYMETEYLTQIPSTNEETNLWTTR